ncbi:MAG: 7-cyano-7-deazaguanine synthase, partial [Deferribacteraceae bacterium]|nr:7-cyano-7-deazaguanine synthase [Deferribacteraceae bacterium]
LIKLNKGEIVRLGVKLKVPFELTWSCYAENEAACGVCDSCRLRLKGFSQAGIEDVIPYSKHMVE